MIGWDLYVFNPTCETAIANGSETYMAPQILRKLETDLSLLPMCMAQPHDYVISSFTPSADFLEQIEQVNFPVCNCASLQQLEKADCLFNRIIPWGWSPAIHFRLRKMKEKVSGRFLHSKVANWRPEHYPLFLRDTAAVVLQNFLSNNPADNYCSMSCVPVVLSSEEQVNEYVAAHAASVLKSPVSSSGRGVQMIRERSLNRTQRQWIRSVLHQQSYLMGEPLLNKKLDLSFQFKVDERGTVLFLGTVFFYTNSNGMYQGHYLNQNSEQLLGVDFSDQLHQTGLRLGKILQQSEYANNYEGFVGVDGMLLDEEGVMRIHPCLEINCRLTMGMIALTIMEKIHPASKGCFEIFSGEEGDFARFAGEMRQKHPVKLRDGYWFSGFLPLTESLPTANFGAFILLG